MELEFGTACTAGVSNPLDVLAHVEWMLESGEITPDQAHGQIMLLLST